MKDSQKSASNPLVALDVPTHEEDVPPNVNVSQNSHDCINCEKERLSRKRVEDLENKRLDHKFKIDTWAVCIMIGCVCLSFASYLLDSFYFKGNNPNETANAFTDISKYLIPLLAGFLFANNVNK